MTIRKESLEAVSLNHDDGDKENKTTFTPTARRSELEALRQRGLTTQLNRHFQQQVAKETAAVQTAREQMKKRHEQMTTSQTTTTTTTIPSAQNRDISPLDQVYLSITKWRRECRLKERNQYASQGGANDLTLIEPDAKATCQNTTTADLPALNIPVSDAAKNIETVLNDYMKTGALELPSVESLGTDVTFSTIHLKQQEVTLGQSTNNNEIDARCPPSLAENEIRVYVGPGAFYDDSLQPISTDASHVNCIKGGDDKNDLEQATSSNAAVNHDECMIQTSDTGNVHVISERSVTPKGGLALETDQSPENSSFQQMHMFEPKHMSCESPPALIPSTRSLDSTESRHDKDNMFSIQLCAESAHETLASKNLSSQPNPTRRRFITTICGVVVGLVGIYVGMKSGGNDPKGFVDGIVSMTRAVGSVLLQSQER